MLLLVDNPATDHMHCPVAPRSFSSLYGKPLMVTPARHAVKLCLPVCEWGEDGIQKESSLTVSKGASSVFFLSRTEHAKHLFSSSFANFAKVRMIGSWESLDRRQCHRRCATGSDTNFDVHDEDKHGFYMKDRWCKHK